MNDLLKWLRSTAKSVAERLAQQGSRAERIRTERNLPLDWLGDGLKIHLPLKLLGDWLQSRPIFDSEKERLELDLPLTGEDNSPTEMANMPAPLTLPQMMASVALHDQKIANLSGRIGKLAEGAKASNRLYMKYRLARLRAAKIAFLYTVQTCNRLQTTHTLRLGKNLVFVDENGAEHAVYIPTGASPTKVETKRRLKRGQSAMSRQFFVARKVLSPSLSKLIREYEAEDLPVLHEYFNREVRADGKAALFDFWDKNVFRRAVEKVARTSVKDVRAAAEYSLKEALPSQQKKVHPDVLAHFLMHQREISIKHYAAAGAEACSQVLWELSEQR